MASLYPFTPYYYSPSAGKLEDLVVPCHGSVDTVSRDTLLSPNPNHIASIFVDPSANGVVGDHGISLAANSLAKLIRSRFLVPHRRPSLFAWFQEFRMATSNEMLVRKNIIGLGDVTPYRAGHVCRHEQTIAERTMDQFSFLQSIRVDIDPILMLYSDPSFAGERILDDVARESPLFDVTDKEGTRHRVFEISDAVQARTLRRIVAGKTLLIADGHHRYEAALQFKDTNPSMFAAHQTMMACTNVCDPALRTRATHRVISGVLNFQSQAWGARFKMTRLRSHTELNNLLEVPDRNHLRIGVILPDLSVTLLSRPRGRDGVVQVLHDELLPEATLGGAPRGDRPRINYVRTIDAAASLVRTGAAQAAFLLEPTPVQEILSTALERGGLMPPKSTGFYPKLLSGLLVRKL